MSKWICGKCKAINPTGSSQCHNCSSIITNHLTIITDSSITVANDIPYIAQEDSELNAIGNLFESFKKLEKENEELRDTLVRLQTFFGVGRDIYYRDLDGNIYLLDNSEINKILEKYKG